VMLGAMTGDLNGAMVVGVQTAAILGGLSYSRAAEAEADREARNLLVTAGINPRGMVTFFERLRKKSSATSSLSKYLSTHPVLDERIKALEDATSGESASAVQLSPSVAWNEMADVCFVHSSVSS
jgi:beta-barrel assembly-enhancing protease